MERRENEQIDTTADRAVAVAVRALEALDREAGLRYLTFEEEARAVIDALRREGMMSAP